MKSAKFLVVGCLVSLVIAFCFSNVLKGENRTIQLAANDSITYQINDNDITECHWHDGKIVQQRHISEGDSINILFNRISYASDSTRFVIKSSMGAYAILEDRGESSICCIGIGDNRRYLLKDSLDEYQLFIDKDGISHSINKIDDNVYILKNSSTGHEILVNLNNAHKTRAFTRGLVTNFWGDVFDTTVASILDISHALDDTVSEIVELLSQGKIDSNTFENTKSIIDGVTDLSDVMSVYETAKTLQSFNFFNDTYLTTGNSNIDGLNADLGAIVKNYNPEKCYLSLNPLYERLASYRYEFGMMVFQGVPYISKQDRIKRSITASGIYSFNYKCAEYDQRYFYAPYLSISVEVELDMDALYLAHKRNWPLNVPIPSGKRIVSRNYEIRGDFENFKTESPDITGTWSARWLTTPPNAKLLTMSLSSGVCTQTYYYANRDANVTYSCSYTYDYPYLTLFKSNGDVQVWKICDYTNKSMTLKAEDGFCYYLVR